MLWKWRHIIIDSRSIPEGLLKYWMWQERIYTIHSLYVHDIYAWWFMNFIKKKLLKLCSGILRCQEKNCLKGVENRIHWVKVLIIRYYPWNVWIFLYRYTGHKEPTFFEVHVNTQFNGNSKSDIHFTKNGCFCFLHSVICLFNMKYLCMMNLFRGAWCNYRFIHIACFEKSGLTNLVILDLIQYSEFHFCSTSRPDNGGHTSRGPSHGQQRV